MVTVYSLFGQNTDAEDGKLVKVIYYAAVMLTFFTTEYVFGCERFYYKWSSMIHTYNVYIHGIRDEMVRPIPPRFVYPCFINVPVPL